MGWTSSADSPSCSTTLAVSGAITPVLDDPLRTADSATWASICEASCSGSQFAAGYGETGGGSIINASSGRRVMAGLGTKTYRAAKAGCRPFTKSIAMTWPIRHSRELLDPAISRQGGSRARIRQSSRGRFGRRRKPSALRHALWVG